MGGNSAEAIGTSNSRTSASIHRSCSVGDSMLMCRQTLSPLPSYANISPRHLGLSMQSRLCRNDRLHTSDTDLRYTTECSFWFHYSRYESSIKAKKTARNTAGKRACMKEDNETLNTVITLIGTFLAVSFRRKPTIL